jgi:RecB family endonuclease NucS
VNGKPKPMHSSLAEEGRTEQRDLESWIAVDPEMVGQDLVLIGRQVQTKSGPLDLLAIDRSGALVVIELKRNLSTRMRRSVVVISEHVAVCGAC